MLNSVLCNHHKTPFPRPSHHPKQQLCTVKQLIPSLLCPQPSNFCPPWIFLFQKPRINGHTQLLSFCVCLVGVASLRPICAIPCKRISFLFMAEYYPIVWLHHMLSIHGLLLDVWVVSTSWLLWIMQQRTGVYMYLFEILLSILCLVCPEVRLLDDRVILFLIFPSWLHQITFPITVHRDFQFLYNLTNSRYFLGFLNFVFILLCFCFCSGYPNRLGCLVIFHKGAQNMMDPAIAIKVIRWSSGSPQLSDLNTMDIPVDLQMERPAHLVTSPRQPVWQQTWLKSVTCLHKPVTAKEESLL